MAGQNYHGDDLTAAVRRIHLGEKTIRVAEDTGIPYETLRKAHADTLRAQRDPYPGDAAIGRMVDTSLQLLWNELEHLKHTTDKAGGKRLDIARVAAIGTALKTFDQLKRANKPVSDSKPDSPLAALNSNQPHHEEPTEISGSLPGSHAA